MSGGEKVSIVFIPLPILSHFSATVKAATLLSDRDERLAITVLIMNLPGNTKANSCSSLPIHPHSRLNFIHLPHIASASDDVLGHIERQKPAVTDAVAEIIKSQKLKRVSAFVIDMLCFSMTDVANHFGAPTYAFYICSAASVGFMVDFQNLKDDHDQDVTAYKESNASIYVSTFVNPVPASVWPSCTFIKERVFPEPFIRRFKEIKGIMVNTFLELELYAISSVSGNPQIPRIYPVGPIVGDDKEERNEILEWLDQQPDSSVVFLCFGSLGNFDAEQVKEIALALEQSEQRFLWVLRFENSDQLLPDGFIDRVKGVGKVVEWAPQKAVLAHHAVGGFVSHCGWNSVLESVWFGVPIATFPLFTEQPMNAFLLVNELGMAEKIRLDYHRELTDEKASEIVGAPEIEAAIRRLMAGTGAREKVKEMQNKARSALLEGGSSYNAMNLFIEDVILNGCP